jgi:methionine-rich copper-binding protein CopC
MLTSSLLPLRLPLTRWAAGLLIVLALLVPLAPAHAAATSPASAPSLASLRQELDALQGQQGLYTIQQARRLADLSRLETALAESDHRPTVDNATVHNLGVFVRSKRQAGDLPASFAVLAAGEETDDDFETVALFIPANVSVSWAGREPDSGATPARVVRLLPGEHLRVNDAEGTKGGYVLNLPAFALETEASDLAAIPTLSQAELDAQPATAPVD